MGYTTDFEGSVTIEPPLNDAEITYLKAFAGTRRMSRRSGPYFVEGGGFRGQDHEADVIDSNRPAAGQPGLWCGWVPDDFGEVLVWDGIENFYESRSWMAYLIDHFLKPGAAAQGAPGFEDFTFDHVVNGTIEAQGEDPSDRWRLIVTHNMVTTKTATISWD